MRIHKFHVTPVLSDELQPLRELALNLRWTWNQDSIELFRRIDKSLWETVGHNPIKLLGEVDQERLETLSHDEGFIVHMRRVINELHHHLEQKSWWDKELKSRRDLTVAYFSAEFGIAETLPIYSGGLGILAGDHLKAASDLGVPLVGIGLLYQKGYFQQYLTNDGWQHERYPLNDFPSMPITIERRDDGSPVRILVEMADRQVAAQVWRAQVGRVPLYLLDTNIPANSLEDQEISFELYGGDKEMRIRQELLLGVGGYRALQALDISPTVCHMNEGHSAFLGIERIRSLMEEFNLTLKEAQAASEAGNVFTTHTPVPAGIDVFPVSLVKTYLAPYAEKLGITIDDIVNMGLDTNGDLFSMAVLAIRFSNRINGVSKLHGEVSRGMFCDLWEGAPKEEIPIYHVTNGIHIRTWTSFDMAQLYDRYLGPKWHQDFGKDSVWESIREIPDEELWRTHERRRERMVAFTRKLHRQQLENRGASDSELKGALEVLDPAALTIGFARRFAPYKRGTLLFHDFDRLVTLISDVDRPVQFIFAGKAHPQDQKGKEFIRKLIHHVRDERIRRRVVFIENYEMSIARYLVQGCDIWLNTPRRPREASGTSGMKATANGALNLSILDGWWDEGYSREAGWAIGHGEEYEDEAYQDMVESRAIYDLLETDVIPLFYDRGGDGVPRGWTAKMKTSLRLLCPEFNTNRMVADYATQFYLGSADRYQKLTDNDCARARTLAAWQEYIVAEWAGVGIISVHSSGTEDAMVGNEVSVWCQVKLGKLKPEDVVVQAFHGQVTTGEDIHDPESINLGCEGETESGVYLFKGAITCRRSGREGFAVRVLPAHDDLCHPHSMRRVHWAE
jgi:glycogen phosphorylase